MNPNLKYILLTGITFLVCSAFVYQTMDAPIHIDFKTQHTKVKLDALGNIYLISDLEVTKYNNLGVLQKTFSTKRYGNIDFVDVSNPLKILVYYKDFQQLLFLDNQLTLSSAPIAFDKLGYEQSNLVCTSSNNSFWLFDKQNNSLLRFSSDSKLLVKTGNLKTLLGIDIEPNFMQENNGYLYLNAGKNQGILLFDIYGTFYKAIAINGIKQFDVVNEQIFYFKDKTLHQYQPSAFNTIQKQFTDTLLKQVYWQNNRFYKVFRDSLIVQ